MKKILVIDDNADMRENITEILELAKYEVITAVNGKEGVILAQEQTPDLILCDIMMPELDGHGVLQILANSSTTASIPFIFLTAKAEMSDMRKGMNLGADDYLTKPFEEYELLNAINGRLRRTVLLKKGVKEEIRDISTFYNDDLGLKAIMQLSESSETKYFKKGSNIFLAENYPRYIYYVVKGMVKIYKSNDDGRDLITEIYHDNDFFGYKALLKDQLYAESAMAIEDTELKLTLKEDFYKLLCSNKDAALKVIQMLAGDALVKKEQLLRLAYDTIRQRVADALLLLAEKNNFRNPILISRENLSQIVGAANESVIRVLSEFKSDGYIQTKGRKIDILDFEALKRFY